MPINKPKRNIARDFSDCSLLANVIKHYLIQSQKHIIEVHNYIESSNLSQKKINWDHLNKKVLNKMDISVSDEDIIKIINFDPIVIEFILFSIKDAIKAYNSR